jgi:hypothetical protein
MCKCRSLAFHQWLLHMHLHLMVAFTESLPHTFKRVYAMLHIATFWQKIVFHDLQSDICKILIQSQRCYSYKTYEL